MGAIASHKVNQLTTILVRNLPLLEAPVSFKINLVAIND
jgi:hypothetical protein